MQSMSDKLYRTILQAQFVAGLIFSLALIALIIVRGDYAGLGLVGGVVGGVLAISGVWPFLMPDWFREPSQRADIVPVILAHLFSGMLFCFVVLNLIVVSFNAQPVIFQMGLAVIVLILVSAITCAILGVRRCLRHSGDTVQYTGAVHEFVLPRAHGSVRRDVAVRQSQAMSKAS